MTAEKAVTLLQTRFRILLAKRVASQKVASSNNDVGVISKAIVQASCVTASIRQKHSHDDNVMRKLFNKLKHSGRRKVTFLSTEEEYHKVLKRRGINSWQARLVRFIQSHSVQKALLVLLLLDVLCVFIELFIDAEYPSCSFVVRDGVSCCPSNQTDDHHGGRVLESSSGHHGSCPSSLVQMGAAGCDEHKWHGAHSLHKALGAISLIILIGFAVELFGLLAAMGKHFFRNPLYTLDFFVVGIAIVVDVIILSKDSAPEAGLVELIIIARVWRFVRIIHGIYATTHETDLHELEKVMENRKTLKEHIGVLEDEIARLNRAVHGSNSVDKLPENVRKILAARRLNRAVSDHSKSPVCSKKSSSLDTNIAAPQDIVVNVADE